MELPGLRTTQLDTSSHESIKSWAGSLKDLGRIDVSGPCMAACMLRSAYRYSAGS